MLIVINYYFFFKWIFMSNQEFFNVENVYSFEIVRYASRKINKLLLIIYVFYFMFYNFRLMDCILLN